MAEKDESYFRIRRWIDDLNKIDAQFQSIDSSDENFWVLYKKARNLQERIKQKLNKPYKITDKNLATKVTKVFNREYSINKFEEWVHSLAYKDCGCLDDFDPTTCHLPHDGAIDIIGTLEDGENWFETEFSYYKGDDPSEGFLYQLYSDLLDITRNIK
jgi:hypothetical protein